MRMRKEGNRRVSTIIAQGGLSVRALKGSGGVGSSAVISLRGSTKGRTIRGFLIRVKNLTAKKKNLIG
jgi:hypothetical protein